MAAVARVDAKVDSVRAELKAEPVTFYRRDTSGKGAKRTGA